MQNNRRQKVYEAVKNKIDKWLKQNKLKKVSDGKHLERNKPINVRIVKVDRVLDEYAVKKFNEIMREGYKKVV